MTFIYTNINYYHCMQYLSATKLRKISIIVVVLVQQIERVGLGLATSTNPHGCGQLSRSIRSSVALEDVLEGLGPLHAVVHPFQFPQVLQEVQEGRVCVRAV